MIGRIRTRDGFVRLRRQGRRVRIDALWCTYVLDPSLTMPHVAFAIGRPVGSAVTRNRLRRRLRALLAEVDLPSGLYLVGARPDAAGLTYQDLSASVSDLAGRVTTRRDR